ncbi:M13 family metallopeptidase [Nonlabens marinus]|uniref:Peptidase, M13 family n=1 Tax=Nonlabens marinus S1-08 TaxID=1454201 RepID=W8VPF6_9FLAO|nr:M13 family metallopeptidase [Nonlabens marinus]BAO55024.1 peptidase, M13 family [Nonlabens marinus S1-08]
MNNHWTAMKSVLILAAITVFTSCKDDKQTDVAANKTYPGIDFSAMDTLVSPKDDFYRYVNGTWIDSTEIPADQTVWGGFNKLRKDTDADVLAILNKAQDDKNLDPKSDQAKAVYVYQSILDTESRNKAGYQPLMPFLQQINEVRKMEELPLLLGELAAYGVNGLISFGVGPDAKDTNMNVAQLGAGSLGMAREYYVEQDADSKQKLEKYQQHIARMLSMTGTDSVAARSIAANIVAFETKLAKPRLDKVASRNPLLSYNPMAKSNLKKLVPAMDWDAYFKTLGVKDFDTLIVSQPDYLKALQPMLTQKNLPVIKEYLKWTMINQASGSLSTALEDANWDFYSKTMRGAVEQEPMDERALGIVNGTVGEALGKLYVEQKFPKEAKEKALEMIDYVKKAYEVRINNLDWMSADTKKKAIDKLNGMTIKIGYPDKWKDYSAMEITSPEKGGNLFNNMMAVIKWNREDNLDNLGEPVDKSEWFMSPQTVNAYYNPYYNEIVFPAAILQPPFYDYNADAAINFGGMGAVIGHEISHGFDDSGARFDAAGNMTNWWTDEDNVKFTGLGDNLATQYSAIEVMPDVFINGKFTLGENIGDLGGVNAAYDALQMWLDDKGRPEEEIDGYTQEQRFFISWATVWRTKMRDEALQQRIKGDTHSPGMYRGYVPLQNIQAFYDAFDIKEGDKMYVKPEDRVIIW